MTILIRFALAFAYAALALAGCLMLLIQGNLQGLLFILAALWCLRLAVWGWQ